KALASPTPWLCVLLAAWLGSHGKDCAAQPQSHATIFASTPFATSVLAKSKGQPLIPAVSGIPTILGIQPCVSTIVIFPPLSVVVVVKASLANVLSWAAEIGHAIR